MTDVSIAVTVKTQEVTKSQFPVPESPLFFSPLIDQYFALHRDTPVVNDKTSAKQA